MNPFAIEGPAVISFSGGRTSGAMLRFILNAHGAGEDGALPPDVHVLFANTGKEREETLDFVHEIETRWNVPIHWLERHEDGSAQEVDYGRASRSGGPFRALILERNFLPNPVTRFCTQELKIRVMKKWMQARGYEHWTNVVGLRADEPQRVARIRAANDAGKERWESAVPLFDAGITRADVDAFWSAQPFDLRLRPWEGNCDLCFLKGLSRKLRVIRDRPDLAEWWVEAEAEAEAEALSSAPNGGRFGSGRNSRRHSGGTGLEPARVGPTVRRSLRHDLRRARRSPRHWRSDGDRSATRDEGASGILADAAVALRPRRAAPQDSPHSSGASMSLSLVPITLREAMAGPEVGS